MNRPDRKALIRTICRAAKGISGHAGAIADAIIAEWPDVVENGVERAKCPSASGAPSPDLPP